MSKKRSKRIVSKRAADKRTTARRVLKVLAAPREDNATPSEAAESAAEQETLTEGILANRLAQLGRLRPAELIAINTNVPNVVARCLGVATTLAAFLPALRQLPSFDFELVVDLETWALVLNRAHAGVLAAERPELVPAHVVLEANELRRVLQHDALACMQRGIIPGNSLATLTRRTGWNNLAHDLRLLAQLFASHGAALSGRCGVTEAEIWRAHALADSLADWVAKSNTSPAESALDLRVRAFTMLVRSYTEARHGVCFLRRREGDANSIIPPLQGGRTRRAKRGAQTAEPSTAAVRPVA